MSDSCDEALTNLYSYLDSELSTDVLEHVRLHLGRCHPCESAFEFELHLKRVVRERLAEDVSPAVLERFRIALRSACEET